MRLTGKTAIVTGGARGIGRAIALRLGREGASVAVNYFSSSEESASALAKEIEASGGCAMVVPGDVTSESDVRSLFDKVMSAWGRVDILVNNAGITRDGLAVRMSSEDFTRVLDVNLLGTFHCSRQAAQIMLRQRGGRIINISSVVGITGNPGQANYAASKAGIIGLTKSLALELASRGITVNAVAPGFIVTDMTSALDSAVREGYLARIPMRKLGEPDDVAGVVSFLASDDSAYITGQVIQVDGGLAT
ncbi:MAG: 3-oxoacyl-[acyl-carrier-protein] reductase [Firmicutes bacterium]|jgi:3-oxoacyl-[acyl-carrier protein] reductase|nr:3-oxoacyl-[acyl-carrier-protein] reductase [Bacillota bacterium]